MKRALISTAALALSLLTAGATTAVAAESPSPSASPSPVDGATASLDVAPSPSPSLSPSVSPSAEPDADVTALQSTLALRPVYTCDEDPSDDFVLPEDGDGVTYTLEDGVFTATPDEGYEWGEVLGTDPWTDPIFEESPYLNTPVPGTTDPVSIPLADFAFPNCNHNDETTVDVTFECTDGMGYLVYDIDAWWATEETTVRLFPYTHDELLTGRTVYEGNELSGRLAWDGSTPGMTNEIGPIGDSGTVDLPDVDDPLFTLRTGSSNDAHQAWVKLDIESADPCLGADGDDSGDSGDGAAGGDKPGDDDELAATGPATTAGVLTVAAALVAGGALLIFLRRKALS
jgi:LPXTG-motif cell wall-anchored protein